MNRPVIRLGTDAQRKAARQGISLRSAGLAEKTQERYLSALAKILPALESSQREEELDEICEEWVEQQWIAGAPLGLVGDALCAVHHYWPQMKGKIRSAWKLFRNWRRLEVPQRAPPLPVLVARALVGLALQLGCYEFGFLIALAFHAYLRTGEFLRLRFTDVQASRDTGVVNIQASKTGLRFNTCEAVAIYDKTVLDLWQKLCRHRTFAEDQLIWQKSGTAFRRQFGDFLLALNLGQCHFQPYSLRRGGATFHFMNRRTLEAILIRGRWRSLSVARLYLEDGLSHAATLQMPPDVLQQLNRWANLMPETFLL